MCTASWCDIDLTFDLTVVILNFKSCLVNCKLYEVDICRGIVSTAIFEIYLSSHKAIQNEATDYIYLIALSPLIAVLQLIYRSIRTS